MAGEPTVYIVDDDAGICDVVCRLAGAIGRKAVAYSSGAEFLAAYSPDLRGCLVLDIWLPDMTGLELYEELLNRNASLPVIVISGHADIPLTVRAIKKGAIDLLEKPFQNSVLMGRMREAIEADERRWEESRALGQLSRRCDLLTEREREIVELLVEGKQNKEIARLLDISPRTVETHRAHIMRKLRTRSISTLIQSALRLRGSAP